MPTSLRGDWCSHTLEHQCGSERDTASAFFQEARRKIEKHVRKLLTILLAVVWAKGNWQDRIAGACLVSFVESMHKLFSTQFQRACSSGTLDNEVVAACGAASTARRRRSRSSLVLKMRLQRLQHQSYSEFPSAAALAPELDGDAGRFDAPAPVHR